MRVAAVMAAAAMAVGAAERCGLAMRVQCSRESHRRWRGGHRRALLRARRAKAAAVCSAWQEQQEEERSQAPRLLLHEFYSSLLEGCGESTRHRRQSGARSAWPLGRRRSDEGVALTRTTTSTERRPSPSPATCDAGAQSATKVRCGRPTTRRRLSRRSHPKRTLPHDALKYSPTYATLDGATIACLVTRGKTVTRGQPRAQTQSARAAARAASAVALVRCSA